MNKMPKLNKFSSEIILHKSCGAQLIIPIKIAEFGGFFFLYFNLFRGNFKMIYKLNTQILPIYMHFQSTLAFSSNVFRSTELVCVA